MYRYITMYASAYISINIDTVVCCARTGIEIEISIYVYTDIHMEKASCAYIYMPFCWLDLFDKDPSWCKWPEDCVGVTLTSARGGELSN